MSWNRSEHIMRWLVKVLVENSMKSQKINFCQVKILNSVPQAQPAAITIRPASHVNTMKVVRYNPLKHNAS
jgi:hypothetical protein